MLNLMSPTEQAKPMAKKKKVTMERVKHEGELNTWQNWHFWVNYTEKYSKLSHPSVSYRSFSLVEKKQLQNSNVRYDCVCVLLMWWNKYIIPKLLFRKP